MDFGALRIDAPPAGPVELRVAGGGRVVRADVEALLAGLPPGAARTRWLVDLRGADGVDPDAVERAVGGCAEAQGEGARGVAVAFVVSGGRFAPEIAWFLRLTDARGGSFESLEEARAWLAK